MGHLRPEFDSLARVWSKGSYFGGLIPRRLPVFVFGEFLRRHIENGAMHLIANLEVTEPVSRDRDQVSRFPLFLFAVVARVVLFGSIRTARSPFT